MGQHFRCHSHSRRIYWADKEPLETYRDRRNIELRNEPEEELKSDCDSEVYLHGEYQQTRNINTVVVYNEKKKILITGTAYFSPTRGVTNPRATRPMVRPIQKPVAVMLLAKALPLRTLIMKVTSQPPSATSTPT